MIDRAGLFTTQWPERTRRHRPRMDICVARHSSFKTWSRLGVGDRLRGSHLDQDEYRSPLSPRFFPVSTSRRSPNSRVTRGHLTYLPLDLNEFP